MIPIHYPRFNLRAEATSALWLGWCFFLMLSLFFCGSAWLQTNPRPRESVEEIQHRVRREAHEKLREKGFALPLPAGPPPEPSPPPKIPWDKVIGTFSTGLGFLWFVWIPLHRELRRRSAVGDTFAPQSEE